jgi:chromate transporter
VAHLGYFQREFVIRRRWVSQGVYAELVAIAQSLPGPASSQVGFGLGLLRAGWLGGLAAWVGFTLPSAALMVALAFGHAAMNGVVAARLFHGLQLVAVSVVAQAVVAMQRSLAPDARRWMIALLGMAIVLLVQLPSATLMAIVVGVVAGLLVCREQDAAVDVGAVPLRVSRGMGVVALMAFVLLLGLTAFVPTVTLRIFAAFYRTGALVFGGGHVVLPLLERAVVDRGWVSESAFLGGYGALQAVPGPLFSFAAYLGAMLAPMQHRSAHALVALGAIFLPGLLLMAAVLPFWAKLRANAQLRAGLRGANASVVGILAAALVRPLVPSTVHTGTDAAFVVAAFALLHVRRVQAWMVVALAAGLSIFVH